jgi:hypothetical protein
MKGGKFIPQHLERYQQIGVILKNLIALILSVPLFCVSAQTENVVIYKKTVGVAEDSSEHNRMGKNHLITAQLFGVNPNGLPGGGLSYGFFLDRSSMIIAEATGSKYGSDTVAFNGGGYDIDGSSVGVHYKKFFGNSFYVKAGMDQRHINLKYSYIGFLSPNFNTAYGFKSDSTAASLVIGNQWQWNSFTLGCDWIGMSVPIVESTSKEFQSGNFDSIDKRNLEDDKRRFTKNGIGQGLRFYLGASF